MLALTSACMFPSPSPLLYSPTASRVVDCEFGTSSAVIGRTLAASVSWFCSPPPRQRCVPLLPGIRFTVPPFKTQTLAVCRCPLLTPNPSACCWQNGRGGGRGDGVPGHHSEAVQGQRGLVSVRAARSGGQGQTGRRHPILELEGTRISQFFISISVSGAIHL